MFLLLALLTLTAPICTAQSWDDSGDWGDDGWGDSEVDSGWEDSGSEDDGEDNSGSNTDNYGGNNQNADSWGSPTPSEISSSDEAAFPSSISESSSTLIEEANSNQYNEARVEGDIAYSMSGGSSRNIFWIVSRDGSQHWRSVNIPCHRYARLFFIPSASGQLTMEELYPNNRVQTYHYGNVRAYSQYRAWFFADTSGTHQMRYRIDNGPYSDILTFYVGNCGGGGGSGGICPCCGRPY